MKLLLLNFLPRSPDLALLLLRLWYGTSLLVLHGWGKLTNFSSMAGQFSDPFGIGPMPSLALSTFGELVCSGLVVLGLFTRIAAVGVAINLATAFWFVHHTKLTGEGNGELAVMYLGAFVALFVAGGGKLSIDAMLGAKT